MSGQYWPEGDEVYHAELTVPILLVHGMCDKFVPMDEDQRMAEVQWMIHVTPSIKYCNIVVLCCHNKRSAFVIGLLSRSSCLHS